MSSSESIRIYNDTVLRQTILQGYEDERTDPGNFLMGELAFTRDTGRVFAGTFTDNRKDGTDCEQIKGGILVGNKFQGVVEGDKIPSDLKVSKHVDKNCYDGDYMFDSVNKQLIIFDGENKIKIPAYEINEDVLSLENNELSPLSKTLSVNKGRITDIIKETSAAGIESLNIINECTLPKKVVIGTKDSNIDWSKWTPDETVHFITIQKQADNTYEIHPKTYAEVVNENSFDVQSDEDHPGIVVRNLKDNTSEKIIFKIGFDFGKWKEMIAESNKQASAAAVQIVTESLKQNTRGLYYLSSLKPLSFSNNILEKNISEIEINEDDTKQIPYAAQSVILQITSKPDNITRIRHLKSTGILLMELPANTESQITTVEVPLIENDDCNDKKFTIHSTSSPTVKLLGYRI